jgi:hypothetical protein
MNMLINGESVKVTRVPVVKSEEKVCEYLLQDGTVVRLRTLLTEVYKYDGKLDANGNPIYSVNWHVIYTAEPGA